MSVWLQVWWVLLHGLFSQSVYPWPGTGVQVTPPPSSGMLIWWKADVGNNCGGSACTDGASQNSWADQSGNGNNGTLTPAIVGPCVASIYHTNQINGKPAVTFNGNNTDTMETCFSVGNTGAGLNNQSATTAVLVVKLAQTAADNSFISGAGNSFNWRSATTAHMQQALKACTASLGTSTSVSNTSWHQLNVTYNGTTVTFRTDRAADGTASPATAITVNWLTLGINPCGGSLETLSGQVAEFILYNRVLSGGEITTVETYLNSKYGL